MINWFKNLFKTKYEVWIYENSRNGKRQEVLLETGKSAKAHAKRYFSIRCCDYLKIIGYQLVKIETRYL